MYTLTIDDLVVVGTSRDAVRERVNHYLETGEVPSEEEASAEGQPARVTSINESPEEREERLRKNWGNDPNVQQRWRK